MEARTIIAVLFACFPTVFNSAVAQTGSSPHGTLIVLNKSDNAATLISLQHGAVVATLPTGQGPHEVAVSPDGHTAIVSNYGSRAVAGSTLTVIELPRLKVAATIALGNYRRPHGLHFLPDGQRALVTVEAQKAVLLVHVPTGKIEKVLETGQNVSHMVVYSPRRQLAFVANIGSGSISILDVNKGTLVKTLATGEGAEGIAITPDETEVWVSNRAANSLSIIDAASLEIKATVPCESFPIRIKITPDARYALVSNARSGDEAVFDVATRREIRRISLEFKAAAQQAGRLFGSQFGDSPVPIGIFIHPSGDFAYVANSGADVVAVIDLRQWKVVAALPTGHEPDGLGYSPLHVAVQPE